MQASGREREIVLPIGYVGEDGRVGKVAVIRKMRGHDEALLYDAELSPARLVTGLIKGCLVGLGGVTAITEEMVAGLYSADRTYLLVEIRRFSLGDTIESSTTCPGCKGEVQAVDDLGQLEVRRLGGDRAPSSIAVELTDGYVDRDGVLHTNLWLRLPRGADEEIVASTAARDPLRARDVLVLRCIESFGSLPRAALEGYGLKILRDLTIGDRRRICDALDKGTPGVDLRRKLRCPHCDRWSSAMLEVSHFFADG